MTIVRNPSAADVDEIIRLCGEVYPGTPSWTEAQLLSHQRIFPEGQFAAVESGSGRVIGYAASLIVLWDDYSMDTPWKDFTDHGMFTNHDGEHGRTLYAAEVMVSPSMQGKGIGSLLYRAREKLARERKLLRMRAGARLRGYHVYADRMTPEDYTLDVVRGVLRDPTLSFQIHRGFKVLSVTLDYLRHDPESLGHAAVIEWLNPDVATAEDHNHQKTSRYFA